MQKIQCPDCGKSFLWTDEMPLQGPCPDPDCAGTYDVHRSLRASVAERSPDGTPESRCPGCGERLRARWGLCRHCGRIVAGSRSFRRRDLLLAVALLLLGLSVLFRHALKM